MRKRLTNEFGSKHPGAASLLSHRLFGVVFLSALALPQYPLRAQGPTQAPPGLAWDVQGSWLVDGKGPPILSGDAIEPGSLLQPADVGASHSIIVLLPDGQRDVYECFTAEDCVRGFRVPALYRRPEPFAINMMARIRSVLISQSRDSSGSGSRPKIRLPRDEVVAALGSDNRVHIGGLAAHLDNGRYTYDLRPLDPATAPQFHLTFEKSGPSIAIPLPSTGLYNLTVYDNLNSARIDLLIAALRPAQAASIAKSFNQVKALLDDWDSDKQGWPIHDFKRAYLQSLLDASQEPGSRENLASTPDLSPGAESGEGSRRAGVTAEPTFSPQPGFFDGRTAITLRCDTPGAAMHYTVDGSQPVNDSPVYKAPIIVMGSGLTIKVFAAAAGRKDSAVVTGSYRIRDGD